MKLTALVLLALILGLTPSTEPDDKCEHDARSIGLLMAEAVIARAGAVSGLGMWDWPDCSREELKQFCEADEARMSRMVRAIQQAIKARCVENPSVYEGSPDAHTFAALSEASTAATGRERFQILFGAFWLCYETELLSEVGSLHCDREVASMSLETLQQADHPMNRHLAMELLAIGPPSAEIARVLEETAREATDVGSTCPRLFGPIPDGVDPWKIGEAIAEGYERAEYACEAELARAALEALRSRSTQAPG